MAELNSLPDDCLLHIFDRIPLTDLLYLDQVCHRWLSLLPSALCRRRSLTLFVSDVTSCVRSYNEFKIAFDTAVVLDAMPPIYFPLAHQLVSTLELPDFCADEPNWSDNHLTGGYLDSLFDILDTSELFTEMARFKHARLSGKLARWFLTNFKNIQSLTVIHRRCTQMESIQLVELLDGWRTNLVGSLRLWLRVNVGNVYRFKSEFKPNPNNPKSNADLRLLFVAIGQLSQLKQQLTLDISNIYMDRIPVLLQIPQDTLANITSLPKVVEINLGNYIVGRQLEEFMNSMFNHKSNIQELRQIVFGGLGDLSAINSRLLTAVPQATIRQLYFPIHSDLNWLVHSSLFSSLNLLRFEWTKEIAFKQLVSNLSMLSELSHLQLSINFTALPTKPFEQSNEDQQITKLISLPQIKILHLEIEQSSHLDFESLSQFLFANVKMTTVVIRDWNPEPEIDCSVCKQNFNTSCLTNQQEFDCRKLLMSSIESKLAGLIRLCYKYEHRDVEYNDWILLKNDDDVV